MGRGAFNHDVVRPFQIDFDVLNMVATLPKNHYIYLYLEDRIEDGVDDGFAEQELEIKITSDMKTKIEGKVWFERGATIV